MKSFVRGLMVQSCQQVSYRRIVTEGLADIYEAIDVSGTEDETCAELKRIFAQCVLAMPHCFAAIACDGIVAPENMQKVGAFQFGRTIALAICIHEQRKCNAGFFAEETRIAKFAQPCGCEICASRSDFGLMLAQLRDMLAAENSAMWRTKTIMAGWDAHSTNQAELVVHPHREEKSEKASR